MEIPEELACIFSAEVTEQNSSYVIEVPKRELAVGEVQNDESYRVALLATETDDRDTTDTDTTTKQPQKQDSLGPPVEEGDTRTVDIESLGEQGDGIARVERGYVIIVPETKKGERVTIEITDVKENVAFGEVIEREEYYQ